MDGALMNDMFHGILLRVGELEEAVKRGRDRNTSEVFLVDLQRNFRPANRLAQEARSSADQTADLQTNMRQRSANFTLLSFLQRDR